MSRRSGYTTAAALILGHHGFLYVIAQSIETRISTRVLLRAAPSLTCFRTATRDVESVHIRA